MSADGGNVRVVCRFRPQNSIEDGKNGKVVVQVNPDGNSVVVNTSAGTQNFYFDKIFDWTSKQADVYEYAAKPVIDDVLKGYNGTIFAYGQTGAGKTFTMMGADIDDMQRRGIIPRMVETIFNGFSQADRMIEFTVKVSFVEIYLERLRDLFDKDKDNLKIKEDKVKGTYIQDVTEIYVSTEEEVYECMKLGQQNKSIASTNMNAESSRSHSIFIVTIYQKNLKDMSACTGRLYLVDLAGSEKVGKTGAEGSRLEEAKNINKSLSALGNVINALTDGKSTHIPYRDSKLTRILQQSLGGNSRTMLIINCSPSSYNEAETISTLRFGVRAKTIKNRAQINRERTAAELKILLSKAEATIVTQKATIDNLEQQLNILRADASPETLAKAAAIAKNAASAAAAAAGTGEGAKASKEPRASDDEDEDDAPALGEAEENAILNELEDMPPPQLLRLGASGSGASDDAAAGGALTEASGAAGAQTGSGSGAGSAAQAERIAELETKLTELEDEHSEMIATVASLQEELRAKTDASDTLRGELKELRSSRKTLAKENEYLVRKLADSTFEMEKVMHEHGEMTLTVESLTENNQSLKRELESLQATVLKLQEQLGDKAAEGDGNVDQIQPINELLAPGLAAGGGAAPASAASGAGASNNNTAAAASAAAGTPGKSGAGDDDESTQNESGNLAEFAPMKVISEKSVNPGDFDILKNEIESGVANFRKDMEAQFQRRTSQAEDMDIDERVRVLQEKMAKQLLQYEDHMSKLLVDIDTKCKKVIDLEIMLDEAQARYNLLLKQSSNKFLKKKVTFLEKNLESLTNLHLQLGNQLRQLKTENSLQDKKLEYKNERISYLEKTLEERTEQLRQLQQQQNEDQARITELEETISSALAADSGAGGGGGGGGIVGGGGGGSIPRVVKPIGGGTTLAAVLAKKNQKPTGGPVPRQQASSATASTESHSVSTPQGHHHPQQSQSQSQQQQQQQQPGTGKKDAGIFSFFMNKFRSNSGTPSGAGGGGASGAAGNNSGINTPQAPKTSAAPSQSEQPMSSYISPQNPSGAPATGASAAAEFPGDAFSPAGYSRATPLDATPVQDPWAPHPQSDQMHERKRTEDLARLRAQYASDPLAAMDPSAPPDLDSSPVSQMQPRKNSRI